MNNVSTIWLAISQEVRFAILLFLILIMCRAYLPFILGKIVILITKVVKWFFSILFMVFEFILGYLFRLTGKSTSAGWTRSYEGFVTKLMNRIQKFEESWKLKSKDKARTKKNYKRKVFALSILFIFYNYYVPLNPIFNTMSKWESTILFEKMKVTLISTDAARSQVKVWFGMDPASESASADAATEVSANSQMEFTLADGVSRANVRVQPYGGSTILGTVRIGEQIIYLGEEALDQQNEKWYKVKTQKGFEGWISSSVVK